jgi:Domain of unknown function (DUF5666)
MPSSFFGGNVMRNKQLLAILFVVITAGCRDRETPITGATGANVLEGTVVMSGARAGSSPAGIQVRVLATGMATQVSESGRFLFAGVPDHVELSLTRDDGIDLTYTVQTTARPLVVKVDGQSGRRRGVAHLEQYEGLIKEVSATSITITDSHRGDVVFVITDQTIIRKGNQTVAATDLLAGQRVHVSSRTDDQSRHLAVEIKLQDENADDDSGDHDQTPTVTANGTVAKVNADSLVVHRHEGDDVTVNVDSKTVIHRQGQTIMLSDIKVGDRIEAEGKSVDASTILAAKIQIEPGSNNGAH